MTEPVRFGLNVDPNTGGLAIAERITAIADAAGLEYVGIQDHPYNAGFVDTLTMITWLAGQTSNVHFFPNVANLPLRPPALLAKQAATIDVLSGGRFELGLGAGAAAEPDGWSVSAPYVPPARLPELNEIITGAALKAGRDPGAITRLYNVMGLITNDDRDPFHGPVGRWVDTLTTLHAESQMNAFVFWPSGDRERQSRVFAEQVVPAVRSAVGASA